MKKILAILALIGLFSLSACSKAAEQFKDASVSGRDDSAAEVYNMPDGFSNVASKCDKHGHRIFVVFHGDNHYGSVAVIDDETCPKA